MNMALCLSHCKSYFLSHMNTDSYDGSLAYFLPGKGDSSWLTHTHTHAHKGHVILNSCCLHNGAWVGILTPWHTDKSVRHSRQKHTSSHRGTCKQMKSNCNFWIIPWPPFFLNSELAVGEMMILPYQKAALQSLYPTFRGTRVFACSYYNVNQGEIHKSTHLYVDSLRSTFCFNLDTL